MQYDFIVLGQGLAGSIVSYELLKQGFKVLVLDENASVTSSKIAAGIFNPVTGKRGVKSWLLEDLLAVSNRVYRELEDELGVEMLHHIGITKVLTDQEQQNDFFIKYSKEGYKKFLESGGDLPDGFEAPFGAARVKNGGWLDVGLFVKSYKKFLVERGCFEEVSVSDDMISLEQDKVIVRDWEAEKLIDARGYKSTESNLFCYLSFRPNKGEMLLVKLEQEFEQMVNKNMFVLPKGDGTYLIGSTFELKYNEEPTEKGYNQLIEKFESMYSGGYEVLEHYAAVRPATNQRRPFIGRHPEHERVFSFNGFGTKGVTLVPYFAEQFVGYLKGENEINPEANIDRHKALFYNS